MGSRVGTRPAWIISLKLVFAVDHLVTVGEHSGGQCDLFGGKSIKLNAFQTSIFIAQSFGDGERQGSVAARGKIFTLPCHCAQETGDVEVRVDEDLSVATEFLCPESAEGQADNEVRALVPAYSFKKSQRLAGFDGHVGCDDLTPLQKYPQGGRHLVGSGGRKSVNEKDFHREFSPCGSQGSDLRVP